MQRSCCNIKKILIFSQRKSFLIFSKKEHCTSQPPPPPKKKQNKTKKTTNQPEKNSLYFQKWNFLALILKKFLYSSKRKLPLYFSKESISYISKNEALHFSAQARKIKNNPRGEKFLYIRKRKTKKKLFYFL